MSIVRKSNALIGLKFNLQNGSVTQQERIRKESMNTGRGQFGIL